MFKTTLISLLFIAQALAARVTFSANYEGGNKYVYAREYTNEEGKQIVDNMSSWSSYVYKADTGFPRSMIFVEPADTGKVYESRDKATAATNDMENIISKNI